MSDLQGEVKRRHWADMTLEEREERRQKIIAGMKRSRYKISARGMQRPLPGEPSLNA